ncbi:MAG: GNAT family protein [Eubacteriales bacterium]
MKYYKKITGKRIYLSPIDADEVDNYIKWMNEEAVAANFGQYNQVVASKADLKWIYEPPTHMQRYAIVLIEGDVLIGSISLHNIDHLNRNAYIGIFIGDAENRNKGYGAEAIRLILSYGFKTMNLHNIALSVHADNYSAIACYKSVGFIEAGRFSDWVFKDGKYVDKIFMSVKENELKE